MAYYSCKKFLLQPSA